MTIWRPSCISLFTTLSIRWDSLFFHSLASAYPYLLNSTGHCQECDVLEAPEAQSRSGHYCLVLLRESLKTYSRRMAY